MIGSNWGWVSKAIVGLAATIAILVAYSFWNDASSEDQASQIAAEQNANYYANAVSIEAQLECAIDSATRDECEQQAKQATRQNERDEYDLAAQTAMAAWTRAMGKAGVIGVAVGILGLGLIFVTYRETRRAADAGFDANEIARDVSRRQLRAYVAVVNAGLEHLDTHDPVLIVRLENRGQTPAYNFRHYITAEIREPESRPRVPSAKKLANIAFEMLGPNSPDTERAFIGDIGEEKRAKIKSGELIAYVCGIAEYTDAFGQQYFYRYRYRTDHHYPEHGWVRSDYKRRNESLGKRSTNDDIRYHER